ncbi:peptide-methionine (S)-S-oxide reductase MsrA [Candidatus Uhrbacteria bacterium]|nr:peptide-methionine (S)-S-oxide reductase MsrA [Candidatus Uhrbacteria bacterium]
MQQEAELAIFGGGCFWCTEAVFKMLSGVIAVTPGYAGGTKDKPTYAAVSSGKTGHAEVVRVEYDPSKISYADLLTVFFATHDPTALNRQGADVGTQYRSIIFYTSAAQKQEAEQFINELNAVSSKGKPIVTEIKPLEHFFEAEEYHKNFYERNTESPYCQFVIDPKLEKVRKNFAKLIK